MTATVYAGLRKFITSSPLVQQEMTFSIAPKQETICVRKDVYAGKSRVREKKNMPTPIAMERIAEIAKINSRPLGAKQIVQEVLSMTSNVKEVS